MIKTYTKKEAKEGIKNLVENFEKQIDVIKNTNQVDEAQIEDQFIKPLFSFLNWNIFNEGLILKERECIVQFKLKKATTTRPDYLFQIKNEKTNRMQKCFFLEAKQPKYDIINNYGYIRQAYQYAHSTINKTDNIYNLVRLSILTNFETLILFDCYDPIPLKKNDIKYFNKQKLIEWNYKDYYEKFDEIWNIFEKENVKNGSLSKWKIDEDELMKRRDTPDEYFLSNVEHWREDIAQSMYKLDNNLSEETLTEASQLIINSIIFVKALSDREIEDDYLSNLLEALNTKGKQHIDSIYNSCCKIFEKLSGTYNGNIFEHRKEIDNVKIENKVLIDILTELKPENSLYNLSAMPVEVIGFAYEMFLGSVVKKVGRGIKVSKKNEIQHDSGIYYTPRFIVDYITENTLNKKLEKCKSIEDLLKIKILDFSCGSGSFLLGAYEKIIEWCNDYFYHLDKKKKIPKKYKQYYKIIKNEIYLTSKIKREILLNNIFGVDLDYKAVEIAQFSLSLKMLENMDTQDIYSEVNLFRSKIIPDLDKNIVCGNSLVNTDFSIVEDSDTILNVNPFGWKVFDEIFTRRNKGFDVIIGNPPYVDSEHMTTTMPDVRNYIKEHYDTAKGNWDLCIPFVEKGIKLLNEEGMLSLIMPNKWIAMPYGEALRNFIKKLIVSLNDCKKVKVFKAGNNPIVFIANKKDVDLINIFNFEEDYSTSKIKSIKKSEMPNDWGLMLSANMSIIKTINENKLKKVSEVYIGCIQSPSAVNEAYPIKEILRENSNDKKPENSFYFVNTGTIDRYSTLWGKTEMTYLTKTIPKTHKLKSPFYKYPIINKEALKEYKENRYKQSITPKIIFAGKRYFEAFYDKDGEYTAGKTTYIILKPNHEVEISMPALLGILNSKIISFYIQEVYATRGIDGGTDFTPELIGNLPLPKLSDEQKNEIENLVNKIIPLYIKYYNTDLKNEEDVYKNSINDLEDNIDKIVFRGFGLSYEKYKDKITAKRKNRKI
jgi:hypothetical protein